MIVACQGQNGPPKTPGLIGMDEYYTTISYYEISLQVTNKKIEQ